MCVLKLPWRRLTALQEKSDNFYVQLQFGNFRRINFHCSYRFEVSFGNCMLEIRSENTSYTHEIEHMNMWTKLCPNMFKENL